MSLAQAASQLTHHLLTAHGLAIRKRSVVLSAIFQLLGKSLLFAKLSSSMKLSVSQPSKETQNKVKRCHELFEEAFESLRCCLEHNFSGNLFCESEDWRHEEFQVCIILLFQFNTALNTLEVYYSYFRPESASCQSMT